MVKIHQANAVAEDKKYPTANYPTDEASIRERITHVLSLYPRLNYTMLQVGLGTGFKPLYWRPVLVRMIEEGLINQDEEMRTGPTGRYNVYTFLSLASSTSSTEFRALEGQNANGNNPNNTNA